MHENLRRLHEFVRGQNAAKVRPKSGALEGSRRRGLSAGRKGDGTSASLRGQSRKDETGSVERSIEVALEESVALPECEGSMARKRSDESWRRQSRERTTEGSRERQSSKRRRRAETGKTTTPQPFTRKRQRNPLPPKHTPQTAYGNRSSSAGKRGPSRDVLTQRPISRRTDT